MCSTTAAEAAATSTSVAAGTTTGATEAGVGDATARSSSSSSDSATSEISSLPTKYGAASGAAQYDDHQADRHSQPGQQIPVGEQPHSSQHRPAASATSATNHSGVAPPRAARSSDSRRVRREPFERRILRTFVRPTEEQSSLVADELSLLRSLRAEAAQHLGLKYEAKTLFPSRPAAPSSYAPSSSFSEVVVPQQQQEKQLRAGEHSVEFVGEDGIGGYVGVTGEVEAEGPAAERGKGRDGRAIMISDGDRDGCGEGYGGGYECEGGEEGERDALEELGEGGEREAR